MLRRIAISAQPLPLSLRFTNVRTYLIIAAFVALSVLTPWAFHQFHMAGATYLPMHFFIFSAALAAGWQAGAIVGLLTPFASYAVSGMPALTILPQVAIEVTAYGLIAGLLRGEIQPQRGMVAPGGNGRRAHRPAGRRVHRPGCLGQRLQPARALSHTAERRLEHNSAVVARHACPGSPDTDSLLGIRAPFPQNAGGLEYGRRPFPGIPRKRGHAAGVPR